MSARTRLRPAVWWSFFGGIKKGAERFHLILSKSVFFGAEEVKKVFFDFLVEKVSERFHLEIGETSALRAEP